MLCVDQFSASRSPCIVAFALPSSPHLARLHGLWRLSQTSGFTLGLEEAENVVLTDCCSIMSAMPLRIHIPPTMFIAVGVFIFPSQGLYVRTGSLDVADDRTGLVVHELDTNLGDTTTRA